MSQKEISFSAIMLSYKREDNLDRIINDVQDSSYQPKEFIVINNNPDIQLDSDTVTVINCTRNFKMFIKLTTALAVTTDHVVFLDDDATIRRNTFKNLVSWQKKYPNDIIGYYGMKVNWENTEAPYWTGKRFLADRIDTIREVDVIGGRITIMSQEIAANALYHLPRIEGFKEKEQDEDILYSLINQFHGRKNYIVPCSESAGYDLLDEHKVGLSLDKDHHKASRNDSVKRVTDYLKTLNDEDIDNWQ